MRCSAQSGRKPDSQGDSATAALALEPSATSKSKVQSVGVGHMLSKLSWSLLIATGMVGSVAGISVTQSEHDAPLPPAAVSSAPAVAAPNVDVMLQSDVVNDEFRRGQALARAASREPFAVFRATPSRH